MKMFWISETAMPSPSAAQTYGGAADGRVAALVGDGQRFHLVGQLGQRSDSSAQPAIEPWPFGGISSSWWPR